MAASSSELQARVLDCGICHEPFSATVAAKQPHVFTSCGHSICKGCTDQLSETCCPFDKKPFRLPLPKNFALIEQMERLSQLLPAAGPSQVRCNGKKRHAPGAVDAVVYCKECRKCLCEACRGAHDAADLCDADSVVPVCEQPARRCEEDELPLTLCCLDCEGFPLICKLCISEHGAHRGHKAELIMDIENRRKVELQDLLNNLNSKVGNVQASIGKALQAAAKLEGAPARYVRHPQRGWVNPMASAAPTEHHPGVLAEAEAQINQNVDRAIAALESRRRELLQEVRDIGAACRGEVDAYLQSAGSFLSLALATRTAAERALAATGESFAETAGAAVTALRTALNQEVADSTRPMERVVVSFPTELGTTTFGKVTVLMQMRWALGFATESGAAEMSQDGLTVTSKDMGGSNHLIRTERPLVSGRHYWELTCASRDGGGSGYHIVGVASAQAPSRFASANCGPNVCGLYMNASIALHKGERVVLRDWVYHDSGCVYGILLDCDQRTVQFFSNGNPVGTFSDLPQGPLFPALCVGCLRPNTYVVDWMPADLPLGVTAPVNE